MSKIINRRREKCPKCKSLLKPDYDQKDGGTLITLVCTNPDCDFEMDWKHVSDREALTEEIKSWEVNSK